MNAWKKLADTSNCTDDEKASAKATIEKMLKRYNLVMDWKTGKVKESGKAEDKQESSQKAEGKQKEGKAKKEASSNTGIWTTKDLASYLSSIIGKNMTPKELRRHLRANWYNDGINTHYRWTGKDDENVKEIVKYFKDKMTA